MKAPKQPEPKTWLRFTGIAFQMIGVLLFFLWIGYRIDSNFQFNGPWGVLAGTLLGIAGGLYLSLREFIKKE